MLESTLRTKSNRKMFISLLPLMVAMVMSSSNHNTKCCGYCRKVDRKTLRERRVRTRRKAKKRERERSTLAKNRSYNQQQTGLTSSLETSHHQHYHNHPAFVLF